VKKLLFFILFSLLFAMAAGVDPVAALPPSEDEPWIAPMEGGPLAAPPDPAFRESWEASRKRKSPEELMIERVAGIHKVVIDPGHGGYDPGLPGEKEQTLKIARALEDVFLRGGTAVVLTRTSNRYLPLSKRVDLVWKERPDLLISIHMSSEYFAVYNVTHRDALVQSLRMKNRVLQHFAEFFDPELVVDRRLPLFLLSQVRPPGVAVEVPLSLDFDNEKTMTQLVQSIIFSLDKDEPRLSPSYSNE